MPGMRLLPALLLAVSVARAEDPLLLTADEIQKRAAAFKFEAGTPGGTLHDWIDQDLKTWNIEISTDATTSSVLGGTVFETLLKRDPVTMAWVANLAEVPLKSEDEDGRVWLVKLNPGVTWSDGEPFNADDVTFTFNDVVLNEKFPCPARVALQMNVKGEKKNVLVEKVDDLTVRFTLPQRFALYLQVINGAYILPRHLLDKAVKDGTFAEALGIDAAPEKIVATGPFIPAKHVAGTRVVLKRNPRYRGKDEAGTPLPYLDSIEFDVLETVDAQAKRFLEGKLDYTELRASDIAAAKEVAKRGSFELCSMGPRAGWSYLAFNQNPRSRPDGTPYVAPHKSAWFRDIRFRRAIAHAIDRDKAIKAGFDGRATALWTPYSPKYRDYFTDDVAKYPFDLRKAAALLDDMGLKDADGDGVREDAAKHPVEFALASIRGQSNPLLDILIRDLGSIGVKVTNDFVDFNVLVKRISTDWDWEAVVMGYTAGPEPLLGKTIWKSGEARRLWNPKADPAGAETRPWEKRIDEIFDEAYTHWDPQAKAFDHTRDVELAHEWQKICAENLPHIYLFSSNAVYAFGTRLGNVRHSLHSLFDIERLFIRK